MLQFNNQLQINRSPTINTHTSIPTIQPNQPNNNSQSSKILHNISPSKQYLKNIQKQKHNQSLTQDSQVKFFNKMPSYFLQVQQQSVIVQQKYQTSDPSQNQPSSPVLKKLQSLKSPKKYMNNSQQIKAERITRLVYSSQIYVVKGNGTQKQIQQKNAYIWDRFLCIGDQKIHLNQITKIKCLLQAVSCAEMKIKIVQNQSQMHYFAACIKLDSNFQQKFNEHYLWFSKIICNKLQSIKHLLKQPRKTHLAQKKITIKKNQQQIQGYIYKKSQHLQNWQQRYIIITPTQLLSYKQKNKKSTFSIKKQHIKYIWTRFDLYNGYLVIKVKHGLLKTQFGIPIIDFCQNIEGNWLFAFYKLMVFGKEGQDCQM